MGSYSIIKKYGDIRHENDTSIINIDKETFVLDTDKLSYVINGITMRELDKKVRLMTVLVVVDMWQRGKVSVTMGEKGIEIIKL